MELADICTQLKQARLEKNMSLQEVSKQTKLHPSMLRNIEEVKNLDGVGKFYLKGFLKIYAQFLGRRHLLKEIDQLFTQEKQKKQKLAPQKPEPPVKETPDKEEPKHKKKAEKPKPQKPPKKETLAQEPPLPKKTPLFNKIKFSKRTLYVILGIIVLLVLVRLPRKKVTEEEIPLTQAEKEGKPAFITPSSTSAESAKPLVSILTQGDVLIEVRADGKLIFQNVILKGSKESWMAKEKLEVKISNPSLVSLEIDNKIIPTSNTKRPALYVITSEGFRVEK